MTEEKMLTTPEVASRLGVTTRRVLALIKSGRLPSKQYGRDHLIKESDLSLVTERKPGRPRRSPEKSAKGSKG
jgi:excisionase family DNA binding protein